LKTVSDENGRISTAVKSRDTLLSSLLRNIIVPISHFYDRRVRSAGLIVRTPNKFGGFPLIVKLELPILGSEIVPPTVEGGYYCHDGTSP
jgi:hypothetical protein